MCQLSILKPSVILALGNFATQTLLNTSEGITRLRGKIYIYEGIRLIPTSSPFANSGGIMKCIQVVFNLPIDKSFDYLVPDHLEDSIEVGKRVKVPFGQREIIGFIVGLCQRPSKGLGLRLREIIDIIDERPILSEKLLRLARWVSEYYLCPLGEAIGVFIPPGLKLSKSKEGVFDESRIDPDKPPKLTPSQQEALVAIREAIKKRKYASFLLYGITGSGKTEVYLQAIEEVKREDKGAIILIPEISLTTQMLKRFSARFPNGVALLHSGLSSAERSRMWRRIYDGEISIVIGARSAIFAPVQRVGLIVVDEEHETSFKQDEASPRYHGRDVAIMRAKIEDAVVLLGSATPSLESYYNTIKGKSYRLQLLERVGDRPLPTVKIVDMRREPKGGVLSQTLCNSIKRILERREQAILFLNRRGYSNFILCRECGLVVNCPHCSVSLTYHLKGKELRCHYCNYAQSLPSSCPSCGRSDISHFGLGIQRVEEEINQLFPTAKVVRMDRDTTRKRGSHERILSAFETHEADILLGTQMVVKGLDFVTVTLVGVISADVALNLPDFRAAERTFNLLTQVAGRSGRGERKGLVIIQTYNPDHYSIVAAKDHDYEYFYQQEIRFRKELGYPPFNHLLNLRIESRDEEGVIKFGEKLLHELRLKNTDIGCQILGPAPCALAKIRGRYRWQILIKGKKPSKLRSLITESISSFSIPSKLRLIIDMDPIMML